VTRDLQRRRDRVARVNAKRLSAINVIVTDGAGDDGWSRVEAVLLDLLQRPPAPDKGR